MPLRAYLLSFKKSTMRHLGSPNRGNFKVCFIFIGDHLTVAQSGISVEKLTKNQNLMCGF